MQFYDIHDQTDYMITISKPTNMEDLSDSFISGEELKELLGREYYSIGETKHPIQLTNAITAEVKKLTDKLDASGKKSIPIVDEELLEVLKTRYFSDFTEGSTTYGRHGNKVCYSKRYKRKKVKATQGDVTDLWGKLQVGFKDRYGAWPSHIPRYDRHVQMFKAFQKIVGWRRVRQHIHKEQAKFFRQIWDNPEEFIR